MPRPKGKNDRLPRKRKPRSKAEEKSRQDTAAKKRAATQGKSRITRFFPGASSGSSGHQVDGGGNDDGSPEHVANFVASTAEAGTVSASANDSGGSLHQLMADSTASGRVVIRAYEQVVLCACAACCWCATMRLVSWMKLSRFADEKLFGCG